MHQSFRQGFEKSAGNDPISDPDTDVLTLGGEKILNKGIGYVAYNATHSRPLAKATTILANQFMQNKRLEDDNPEPTAPLALHDGVF